MRTHALQMSVAAFGFIALASTGQSMAQGPNCSEAVVLGLELSGALVAPVGLVGQIEQDLYDIRSMYPEVVDIVASPDWAPGSITVGFSDNGWAQYQAGTFADLDSLNGEYGMVVTYEFMSIRAVVLTSSECYHPQILAGFYSTLEGISFAEPIRGVYGDVDDITSTQVGHYTFRHVYPNCVGGLTCAHLWDFSVIAGAVSLIREYGDPSGVGDLPNRAGVELRQNYPNPFNPETSIQFALGAPAFARVNVYDLSGRIVCELFAGDLAFGEHEVVWRGRDSAGAAVASGTYVYSVAVGRTVVSKKMVMLD